ncbi:hypothetical protein NPX13_g5480 [Xylaria arbuscula]|uniref:Uncharacterized protein n=1 Tax=Xylaria arbuscula TaxID=114810 RepID=A0A9W8TN46_9PEZI|nr:hypothetical protein NPX13_g5480 [Xylaria arbuscula]
MAPPRLKLPKKKKQQYIEKLDDEEDYVQLGNTHEEAMGKHRHGDNVKALRAADRALDVYSRGLAKFPRSFDLAYNKGRLQLEMVIDPDLSEELNTPAVLDLLRQALVSLQYARGLEPTHPDALYNISQALTKMAEINAEDESDDSEAIRCHREALSIYTYCYQLQADTFAKNRVEIERAMRETAQEDMSSNRSEQLATANSISEPQDIKEGQWVSVEEPITADTLLDTIIAQLECLKALCSTLASSSQLDPDMSALSWIHEYQTQLLTHTLPTLLSENQATLGPRLCDVMLVRATFMCYYLELSFKWSVIDVKEYKQELDTAYTQPGLDHDSEIVLEALAENLISFNSALANSDSGAYATLRWSLLMDAQSRLSKVDKKLSNDKKNLLGVDEKSRSDQHRIATTHLQRGDISLLFQVLAYPPNAHPQAQATTSQLLTNAEGYYGNASYLFGKLGPPAEEDKARSELRKAVVNVLQQVNASQAVSGSSSGQGNGGTVIDLRASQQQLESALGSIVKVYGGEWVRDSIEEMVSEGLVLPQIFSAVIDRDPATISS